jgi:purine operon repressor
MSREGALELARELCGVLQDPTRILSGGFLYMTDVVFSPRWSFSIGQFFAGEFREFEPEYVVTVETKGIPLALMTARCLNVPPIVLRRNTMVTEGSSVGITYLSGSSDRIQTMSLARRALAPGSRVLLVDDFMKGGGTARGMHEMMEEFEAEVVGLGLLVATEQPEDKMVSDYEALLILRAVDDKEQQIAIEPAAWLVSPEDT